VYGLAEHSMRSITHRTLVLVPACTQMSHIASLCRFWFPFCVAEDVLQMILFSQIYVHSIPTHVVHTHSHLLISHSMPVQYNYDLSYACHVMIRCICVSSTLYQPYIRSTFNFFGAGGVV
jgi:hypothetical protein